MHGYSKIFIQTICVSTVLHIGGKISVFYVSASTVLHFGGENSSYSYCYSMYTGNGGVSGSTGVDERRGGLPSLPADQSRWGSARAAAIRGARRSRAPASVRALGPRLVAPHVPHHHCPLPHRRRHGCKNRSLPEPGLGIVLGAADLRFSGIG